MSPLFFISIDSRWSQECKWPELVSVHLIVHESTFFFESIDYIFFIGAAIGGKY